jgi:hypothetical protein
MAMPFFVIRAKDNIYFIPIRLSPASQGDAAKGKTTGCVNTAFLCEDEGRAKLLDSFFSYNADPSLPIVDLKDMDCYFDWKSFDEIAKHIGSMPCNSRLILTL